MSKQLLPMKSKCIFNEESAVAVTFSGEAAEMLENNEHLHYVIPSEGSNLWFDNIVMPKTAKIKRVPMHL